MTAVRRIVIVGASQAGSVCAAELRALGFDGRITMIGDEPHRPYTRPPLSKGVLTGVKADSSVFLVCGDDIDVQTATTAIGLDTVGRTVELANGDRLAYDDLVIATGARARRISSRKLHSEVTLRNLDDAVTMRAHLDNAREVVVVGGGFLGMEIASSAASLGKSVTVIDQITPLSGHLGSLLSDIVVTAAAEIGVKVGVEVGGVNLGSDGRHPTRVMSTDGAVLAEADLVITAAGDMPNVEWLFDSGLPIRNGLVADDLCRVAHHIVAAGDVVVTPATQRRRARNPYWWNALEQAKTAASTLLDRRQLTPAAAVKVPYFWTEAFGQRIRIAGYLPPSGEPVIIDGSLAERRALLVWPATPHDYGTAVSLNYPISAGKLTRLARQVTPGRRTPQ